MIEKNGSKLYLTYKWLVGILLAVISASVFLSLPAFTNEWQSRGQRINTLEKQGAVTIEILTRIEADIRAIKERRP